MDISYVYIFTIIYVNMNTCIYIYNYMIYYICIPMAISMYTHASATPSGQSRFRDHWVCFAGKIDKILKEIAEFDRQFGAEQDCSVLEALASFQCCYLYILNFLVP